MNETNPGELQPGVRSVPHRLRLNKARAVTIPERRVALAFPSDKSLAHISRRHHLARPDDDPAADERHEGMPIHGDPADAGDRVAKKVPCSIELRPIGRRLRKITIHDPHRRTSCEADDGHYEACVSLSIAATVSNPC